MKRSRFTEEQIIAILREQEAGVATAEVCRKHGISTATFYAWKAKYGGLDVSQARKLLSERRACAILGFDRTSVRYRSSQGGDADLRGRLRALAGERRRFGWRRLMILLAREGITPNHKKLRRVYAEERLQVRRRGGRKRALGTRAPMAIPQGPNQRWSLDFVSDALTDGRRFRMLAVVDDHTASASRSWPTPPSQGRG